MLPMVSRPWRWCVLLVAWLVVAPAGCGMNAAALVMVPAPVKLGLAAPMMGPDHAAGNRTMQAVQLAVSKRNERGGVAGCPVELVVHDDHTPGTGEVAAQRLAADPAVLAAVGHIGPQSAEQAVAVYRARGLAAVLLAAAGPARSGAPAWVLRLAPSYEGAARAVVQFAADTLGAKSVAVVAGPDTGDAALADVLRQAAQATGLRVARTEALFASSTDYAGAVARLAAARPDVLLVAAGMPSRAAFWREAAGTARAAIIVGAAMGGASEFAAVAGPAARTAYLPALAPVVGERADLTALLTAFRERWGTEPDAAALLAYDAADLLLEAMDRGLRRNPADARAAVHAELHGLREYGGVTGRLRFTEQGELEDASVGLAPAAP